MDVLPRRFGQLYHGDAAGLLPHAVLRVTAGLNVASGTLLHQRWIIYMCGSMFRHGDDRWQVRKSVEKEAH